MGNKCVFKALLGRRWMSWSMAVQQKNEQEIREMREEERDGGAPSLILSVERHSKTIRILLVNRESVFP